MITLNQTALNDNQVIWVIKVTLDSSYLYFSDTTDKVTLSGTDFDGKVILKDSLSDITESIDILNGGGIEQVSSFSFGIARYNNYTGASNFFNDIYPEVISGRTVDFGVCWVGAATLGEITWLKQFYVYRTGYENNVINVDCEEKEELSSINLPYYKIQKDYDNGVSYYWGADKNVYGRIIPLLYGLPCVGGAGSVVDKRLIPAIWIHKQYMKYKIASHPCKAVANDGGAFINKYVSSVQSYLGFYTTSQAVVNSLSGCEIRVYNTIATVARINRSISFRHDIIGSIISANVEDPDKVFDDDGSTYCIVPAGSKLALAYNDKISLEMIAGTFTSCQAKYVITWSSNSASLRTLEVYGYFPWNGKTGVKTSFTCSSTTSQDNETLLLLQPVTSIQLKEILSQAFSSEYIAENKNTTAGEDIRIHNIYSYYYNIRG